MRRGRTTVELFLAGALGIGCGAHTDSADGVSAGAGGSGSAGVGGAASVQSSSSGQGGGGGPAINGGFIGGPCESSKDCAYAGALCLTEKAGFPGGMCSLDCNKVCPDKDGFVSTFCTTPEALGTSASAGLCTTHCDYGQSPSGCRAGYQCQPHQRFGDNTAKAYVCVPGSDAPFKLSVCHEKLLARAIPFSPAAHDTESPTGHPELKCDIVDPVWIAAELEGVVFHPDSIKSAPKSLFAACPLALALDDASKVLASANVTDVEDYGIYNCRVIAGSTSLSEHGHANAIDWAGFLLKDGKHYTVLDDWQKNTPSPTTAAGKMLKSFAKSLYDQKIFNIILTPDYNAAHDNHFHTDLTQGSHFLK